MEDLRDIELGVAQRFNEKIKLHAERQGVLSYVSAPLGAQDQEHADHLLSSGARFALVEFKANHSAIKTESTKELRIQLFRNFAQDKALLKRSRDCHYICWGELSEQYSSELQENFLEEDEKVSSYALKVAPYMNNFAPGFEFETCVGDVFARDFFGSQLLGGNYKRFYRYADELGKIAKGAKTGSETLEGHIYVYWPTSGDNPAGYRSIRFRGLSHMLRLSKSPEVLLGLKTLESGNSFKRA
ncbi:hypothetical protein [Pseudomonas sp. OTU750018]|uniref:hypothetical protein n=1 Tax=Pseudomonas sp. OTU750018 TaxID=2709708 RepID=UPI0014247B48|nr:hypothetical protein [Pseudomonas sp. OTU750018]